MKSLARFFGIASEKDEISMEAPIAVQENIDVQIDNGIEEPLEVMHKNDVYQLKVCDIVPNPFQPRKVFNEEALHDLALSIKEFGVIQPLLVRAVDNHYELVAGERRLRASGIAGLKEVPAIVKILTDKEMAELAMIENLQREDLHFLEEAEGFYQLLLNFGFTQDELAKRMGKSQSTIANKLRLLKINEEVRNRLYQTGLTERHARALLKITDGEKQLEVLSVICEKELNVRETEAFIQDYNEQIAQELSKKPSKRNIVRVVRDVRIFLNTINQVVAEMKKSGLKIKVNQEQDEHSITVKMVIPKQRK